MISNYGTKVFLTNDIKEIDRQTLLIENITEPELIARVADALYKTIHKLYPPPREVVLFCGPGNNGNDGRALAPLLNKAGYRVRIFDFTHNEPPSLSHLSDSTLLIDALFGSGLNRPLDGAAAVWVQSMNKAPGIRIAIDIPSGWHGEENHLTDSFAAIRAHHTLTLEFPKLSLFFPESAAYAGAWQIVPFGLSSKAVEMTQTPYRMVSPDLLLPLIKPLPKFLHKGTAGRVRLLAGSPGMMGAAALAVKAAYRTGAGWVEAWVPETEIQLMQAMVPETIVRNVNDFGAEGGETAVFGAGPGLGVSDSAINKLRRWLGVVHRVPILDAMNRVSTTGCVLDADALNILAIHPDLWQHVPQSTIITPHPGEFKRLAGSYTNDFQRLQLQRDFAAQHKIIVILKGAYTSTAFPDGTVYFNTSGNPGMATAGSGDVLTGILLGLLAQGLTPQQSAILGVYLHGLAGDIAAKTLGERSVMASDVVDGIGKAFGALVQDEIF